MPPPQRDSPWWKGFVFSRLAGWAGATQIGRHGLATLLAVTIGAGAACRQGPAGGGALSEEDLLQLPATVRAQVQAASEGVRHQPDSAEAAGALGMVLHAYSQFGMAERAYLRAHALDPKKFDWLYYLGQVKTILGRPDGADTLRRAFQSSDGALAPGIHLGRALVDTGRIDEAVGVFRELAALYRNNPSVQYQLGVALLAANKPEEAEKALLSACALFPAYGAAHYSLSQMYAQRGRPDDAARHRVLQEDSPKTAPSVVDPWLDAVARLDQSPQALLARGAALERAGRVREAVGLMEGALTRDPALVIAHVNLMSLYFRLKEPQQVQRHFDAAMSIDPSNPDLHVNRGVVLMGEGKDDEAMREFLAVLEANPQNTQALKNLAVLAERGGNTRAALGYYEQALSLQPGDRVAAYHAGRLLVVSRSYREARRRFIAVLSPGTSQWPTFVNQIARLYVLDGKTSEARAFAREAEAEFARLGLPERAAAIRNAFGFAGDR